MVLQRSCAFALQPLEIVRFLGGLRGRFFRFPGRPGGPPGHPKTAKNRQNSVPERVFLRPRAASRIFRVFLSFLRCKNVISIDRRDRFCISAKNCLFHCWTRFLLDFYRFWLPFWSPKRSKVASGRVSKKNVNFWYLFFAFLLQNPSHFGGPNLEIFDAFLLLLRSRGLIFLSKAIG